MSNEFNKQNKRVNLNMAVVATTGYLLAVNTAFANENTVEVDSQTPDSVILEDKNLDIMFKALEPSVRLELDVEGVDKEVKVKTIDDKTVLHIVDGDKEDAQLVKRVYSKITGKSDVETKLVSSKGEIDSND